MIQEPPEGEERRIETVQYDRTVLRNGSVLSRQGQVDWVLPNNYEPIRLIGQGGYGTVMLAKDRELTDDDGQPKTVTIKRLTFPFARRDFAEKALREITYLDELYYCNQVVDYSRVLPHWFVQAQTNEVSLKTVYIVTEYCGRDLRTILESLRNQNQRFDWQIIARIIHQVVCGLKYMHSAGLIHRDLKPANICVDTNTWYTKIIDLGLSRRTIQHHGAHDGQLAGRDLTEHLSSVVQTEAYRAPEVLMGYARHTYDSSIDIWSLGVILAEMIVCRPWLNLPTPLIVISSITRLIGRFPDLKLLDNNVQALLWNDQNLVDLLTIGVGINFLFSGLYFLRLRELSRATPKGLSQPLYRQTNLTQRGAFERPTPRTTKQPSSPSRRLQSLQRPIQIHQPKWRKNIPEYI